MDIIFGLLVVGIRVSKVRLIAIDKELFQLRVVLVEKHRLLGAALVPLGGATAGMARNLGSTRRKPTILVELFAALVI